MTLFAYGFAVILIAAGIYHFVNPSFYYPIIPGWMPRVAANVAGGVAEILIGLGMLVPATRELSLWSAAILMALFLPIHVVDLLRDRPVIGSKLIAVLRLLLQFLLIGWLVWEARRG
ncbi:putative membrane protein [Neolewinella xylanilytica]|uniref:Putative membrane protein n=1 Tax=Neolewinella xylanilytica TaxID=1514080 RepID=A0A2S6I5N8_9BACT|nr:hypothetical protein [Neolewinella xylanilytica]PPK86487.1 putative membrane protein [Neolewinella xylanilytica]